MLPAAAVERTNCWCPNAAHTACCVARLAGTECSCSQYVDRSAAQKLASQWNAAGKHAVLRKTGTQPQTAESAPDTVGTNSVLVAGSRPCHSMGQLGRRSAMSCMKAVAG